MSFDDFLLKNNQPAGYSPDFSRKNGGFVFIMVPRFNFLKNYSKMFFPRFFLMTYSKISVVGDRFVETKIFVLRHCVERIWGLSACSLASTCFAHPENWPKKNILTRALTHRAESPTLCKVPT